MNSAKTLTWAFKQNNDRMTLHLIGELSRNTLLPLWEQRDYFLSAEQTTKKTFYVDLSELIRIDSAGFALLCQLLNHWQTQTIFVQNAPHQLTTLADLFGLSNWLTPYLQTGNK